MRSVIVRCGIGVLACSCVLACAGCFVGQTGPAPEDRGEPAAIAPGAWPNDPIPSDLVEIHERTPGLILRHEAVDGADFGEKEEAARAILERPGRAVTHNELTAHGLLRVFEHGESMRLSVTSRGMRVIDDYDDLVYGMRPNASFVSAWWYETRGRRSAQRAAADAETSAALFERLYPGLRRVRPTERELLLEEGVGLEFPEPREGVTGVVLRLPAIIGNDYERRFIARLEREGWSFVNVRTSVSATPPNLEAIQDAVSARSEMVMRLVNEHPDNPFRHEEEGGSNEIGPRDFRRHLALLNEMNRRATEEIPIPETGFEVREGDDPEERGAVIAEAVDRTMMEHALAAEAAAAYIDAHRPDLSGLPLVVMGFSGGALAAPTVAARLGDRVSAVVLIGGGADLFDLSRRSRLTDGGIRLSPREGAPAPRALIDRVHESYLRHTRLDPYHTAPALRGVPVLHLYALGDDIVPTSGARLLNERIGGVDTQVTPAGHGLLFFLLPGRASWVSSWLDRHVERGVAARE